MTTPLKIQGVPDLEEMRRFWEMREILLGTAFAMYWEATTIETNRRAQAMIDLLSPYCPEFLEPQKESDEKAK